MGDFQNNLRTGGRSKATFPTTIRPKLKICRRGLSRVIFREECLAGGGTLSVWYFLFFQAMILVWSVPWSRQELGGFLGRLIRAQAQPQQRCIRTEASCFAFYISSTLHEVLSSSTWEHSPPPPLAHQLSCVMGARETVEVLGEEEEEEGR